MPTRCFPPGPCRLRSIVYAPRDTPPTCAPTRGWITTYRRLKQPTSALPSKRPSADRPLPPAPPRARKRPPERRPSTSTACLSPYGALAGLRRGPGQHRDERRRARGGLDAEAHKRREHSPGDEDRRDAPERRDLARRIGAAEQSDDDPDADYRPELAHCLVDGAAEGEPSWRQAVDRRTAQRGQDETDARSGHQRRREPGAEEVGWGLDRRVQERSAQREDDATCDEHRPMSAAVGDAAGDDGDRDHRQRSWRDREARLEERVSPPLGKKEDEVEEHGGECDRKYEHSEVPEAIGGIRKQAKIHRGRRCCPRAEDEARKQQSSSNHAGQRARIEEPPAASLDDTEREQRDGGDEQDDPDWIGQIGRRFVARLEEQAVAADHRGDADRDVDVEDPPPAPGLDDERPQRGSDRGGQRAHRAP